MTQEERWKAKYNEVVDYVRELTHVTIPLESM
jgi:hypothetical protein